VWFTKSRPFFHVFKGEDGVTRQAVTEEEFRMSHDVPVEPSEKEYLLVGTVKKHELRDGIKQTVMSRCGLYTDAARAAHEAKEAKKAERAAKKAAKAAKQQEKAA
jgi:hypothetical protein